MDGTPNKGQTSLRVRCLQRGDKGQRFSINATSRESGNYPEQRCMLRFFNVYDIFHGKIHAKSLSDEVNAK